jgi:hypothetical protein
MTEMIAYLAIDNAELGEVCLLVGLMKVCPKGISELLFVLLHRLKELTKGLLAQR